jgi:error-prone DNA polymerase
MEDGTVVPVLVSSQAGYRRLCALLTTAHLRAPKGEGRVQWAELTADNTGLIALTGDGEGPVRRAWRRGGAGPAAEAGEKLLRAFGRDRLYAELQRHLVPDEEEENEFVTDWARAQRLPLLATNGVLHATPEARPVADVFTCLREQLTLDTAGRKLAPNRERHLKTAGEMAELFADLPEALDHTVRLAERLQFTLDHLGYRFPDYPVAGGESQESFLRQMTYAGAATRFGAVGPEVRRQLDRELALIGRLGSAAIF